MDGEGHPPVGPIPSDSVAWMIRRIGMSESFVSSCKNEIETCSHITQILRVGIVDCGTKQHEAGLERIDGLGHVDGPRASAEP